MAFEKMLLDEGLVDPASTGLKDSQINEGVFAKGLTSIMISGEPGRLGQMNDPKQSEVAGDVEAILVPTESGKTRSYGLLEALAIPKVSQHKEAALEFIKWFTSKDWQMENYASGFLPTRTSALAALNEEGKLISGDALVEESKYVEPLFPQGTPTWYPQFSSAVNTAINSVAKGEVTGRPGDEEHRRSDRAGDGSMTAVASTGTATKHGAAGNGDAMLGILLVAPILITMASLVFYPLVETVWDSLHRVNPMQPGTPFVGLANYTYMLRDPQFGNAWVNTFIYVVLAVAAETIFGVLAAALINQVKHGRKWLLAAVILPWALPGVVNAVIWLWIYQPGAGLLNGILTAFGLPFENHVWFNEHASAIIAVTVVHVWRMMPLTVVIVLAAMQSIPDHLYEAARIDGASRTQMFVDDHAAADQERHRRGDDQRDGLRLQPVRRGMGARRFQPRDAAGAGPDLPRDLPEPALLLRHGDVAGDHRRRPADVAGLRPPRLSQHPVRLT